LELGVSVLSAALRGEATGAARAFNADVMATAKRDLAAGELLDGEGGFCVFGKLAPAKASLAQGALPIGLAHGVKLLRSIKAGETVAWNDVDIDPNRPAAKARREMEARFAPR
jgi:predicted homoserine dehydrogenase-like protein